MSVAELLFDVMGPVVVIAAVGWLAATRMSFDVATLSRIAFWVLGPAFAFDVFVDAEIARGLVVRLVAAALIGMVVAGLVGLVIGRAAGFDDSRRDAFVMTSAWGNVGNAGLAISVFAFGDDVAPIAALLMITINVAGMTLGVALGSSRTHGQLRGLRRGFGAPMTLASLAALVVNVGGLDVPTIADRSISLVAAAMIPVMLLTLGMQLAQNGEPGLSIDAAMTGLTKLIVAPLAAAGVGRVLGLEGPELGVLVLQSAMPPAVFCAVVAIEYDLEPDRVSRTVVATTLLALLTLPLALAAVT